MCLAVRRAGQLGIVAFALFAGAVFAGDAGAPDAGGYDSGSGFFIAPGYRAAIAHCTACHSAQLVIQQGQPRGGWMELIEWMQSEHGLWPIPQPQLDELLDYLSAHYGPGRPHFGRSE